jgi:hypothetical protein
VQLPFTGANPFRIVWRISHVFNVAGLMTRVKSTWEHFCFFIHFVHWIRAKGTIGAQSKLGQLRMIGCLTLSHDDGKDMGEVLHQLSLSNKLLDDLPIPSLDACVCATFSLAQQNLLFGYGQLGQIQSRLCSPQHDLVKDLQTQRFQGSLAFTCEAKLTDRSGDLFGKNAAVLCLAMSAHLAQ